MVDPDTSRSIPYYVIKSALENAGPDEEYVVLRSDNDYTYARTLDEANEFADEFRSEIEVVSPLAHTVQVVELQATPPAAPDELSGARARESLESAVDGIADVQDNYPDLTDGEDGMLRDAKGDLASVHFHLGGDAPELDLSDLPGGRETDENPELEPRETCPKCGSTLVTESEDPLEEYCINHPCDYYRAAGGRSGVIRE